MMALSMLRRGAILAASLSVCVTSHARAEPLGFGAYVGNSPAELSRFERWVGRPVDHIAAHTGRENWKDWVGSIKWSIGLWAPVDKPIAWTIPLMVKGGSLADAAAGKYDDFYRQGARLLAASCPKEDRIYIRTGEEFNGDWMPWAAQGHERDFIAAYRRFVAAFRSQSPRFRFEWNVNVGETRMNAADGYPGDDDVDVIGMDFYYNRAWDPADPILAWNKMVERPYGLKWLEQFAAEHKKPTAYPEWGVNSDAAGPYIKKAAEWFASHRVVYERVWDSNDGFPGKLSDGQYPNAGAAYIAAFGAATASPRSPRHCR
ncbi:MAG TPA: glycosyl hydrolase [Xanthobacteraceae bacterium]|nr:glycosyl hydrolase [Xanthobacteraceae bacterium]